VSEFFFLIVITTPSKIGMKIIKEQGARFQKSNRICFKTISTFWPQYFLKMIPRSRTYLVSFDSSKNVGEDTF